MLGGIVYKHVMAKAIQLPMHYLTFLGIFYGENSLKISHLSTF